MEPKITIGSKGSLYKEVVTDEDNSGELKSQFTIDLTEYDTSKMVGYKAGDRVYKGYTCKIAMLKINKPKPRSRVDIDPSNVEIRRAIMNMYSAYDKLVSSKKS